MADKPDLTLIIAVYKRTDFLELVLMSVADQSSQGFEVIIAEDDDFPEMAECIDAARKKYRFPIKHVRHADRGFRKNKILNDAIRASEGRQLVFIDGDCILHRHFLKEHRRMSQPDNCLFGRRVELDPATTEKLMQQKNLGNLSFARLLFTKSRRIGDSIYLPLSICRKKQGLRGCNFSIAKDVLVKINGFDEDFEKPFGGEDDDIERRLKLIGIKLKCTRFQTVQYHLYHEVGESRHQEWLAEGRRMVQRKVEEGAWYCKNGLSKAP